ncbi:hypothetical protein [Streptomyces sp. CoH27]|uniref:hypothetical protein n=1 Tax=Streptomyces sp. CoH27 TaxID=2875763 RepID=UPI001CD2E5D8|nr:hypothetical protein [Streptomyces sp. CoH27]
MGDVFGVEPGLLGDDRLARALDAIAPHLDQLVGTVGAQAIAEFGIDVSRIHWDMTSMSLFGAYEDQDGQFPQVKYGHPKDRRVDPKQIQEPDSRSPATAGSRSSTASTTAARARSPRSSAR